MKITQIKRHFSTLTLIIAVGFGAYMTTSQSEEFVPAKQAYEALQQKKAVLIDIREEDEVKSGMAVGATWMPLSAVKDGNPQYEAFLKDLPKDREIIAYCRSGNRVKGFTSILKAKGISVKNMGGFSRWKDAGLPSRSGP